MNNDALPAATTIPSSQPKRVKSPPLAFEPTPNDTMAIPQRQVIPSASPLPFKHASYSVEAVMSPPLAPLNGTNGVRSSSTPAGFSPGAEAPEQNWRSFCSLQRQAIEMERSSWAMERSLLEGEVARLQQELLIAQTKLKQAELARDDPASFHRSIAARSTRSLSRGSSPSSNPMSNTTSKTTSPPRGTGAGAQVVPHLPSIQENNTSGRSESPAARRPSPVSTSVFNSLDGAVARPHFTNIDVLDEPSPLSFPTPITMYYQEDPHSPSNSVAPLSPFPADYVRHAGHTPRPSDFPAGQGQDTPTRLGTKANENIPHNHETDEDPVLKGPLILPTNPQEGELILAKLGNKLQEAVDESGHATPSVLAHALPIDLALANARLAESATSQESGDTKRHGSEPILPTMSGEQLGDAGPRLKIKRSMNFGAPLGSLSGFK